LGALGLAESDRGAAQLARQYARVIDQAYAMRWVAPHLLEVLTALQATPASRPAAKPAPAGPSQLDKLRAMRARDGRPGA
jgi:hypothetical protein